MSGKAPASGFSFQSDTFAFIAIHALASQPLDWFGENLLPIAISMETGTPGDDLQIELDDGRKIEIQTKKGLTLGKDFFGAISTLIQALEEDPSLYSVLLVDPSTSGSIRNILKEDIIRIGSGRRDGLKEETKNLLKKLKEIGLTDLTTFRRLRIVVKDFTPSGDGRHSAITLSRLIVSEASKAKSSWKILSHEGLNLSARRDRIDLIGLANLIDLNSKTSDKIRVKSRYLDWIIETTANFFVPALDLRLPISEAWTQLRILGNINNRPTGHTLEDELAHYHEWWRLADNLHTQKNPASNLLANGAHLVVMGGPGSGKSILLQNIAHEAARKGRLVLRFSLFRVKLLMAAGRSFEESVASEAFQGSGIPLQEQRTFLDRAEILLADGLDETESYRPLIAKALSEWAMAHPKAVVCITTRPIGYQKNLLRCFEETELLPLDTSAVEKISKDLLRLSGHSKVDMSEILKDNPWTPKSAPNVASLAKRNPLLLTFLVRLHIDGYPLTGKRIDLYNRIIELLSSKASINRLSAKIPTANVLRHALYALAWKLQSTPGCVRLDAINFVTNHLEKKFKISPIEAEKECESILEFWEDRGLIESVHSTSEQGIAFIHLSLAEFAAGKYIGSLECTELTEWLKSVRRDRSWQATIALASGGDIQERILRLLISLDDPNDPNSDEAILATSVLLEMDTPSEPLFKLLSQILSRRIDSDVPMISWESAQCLASVSAMMPSLVQKICISRLEHKQIWTRLAAHAVLFSFKDVSTSSERLETWAKAQIDANAKGRWATGTYKVRKLQEDAQRFAIEHIFKTLPKHRAKQLVERLISKGGLQIGLYDDLRRILESNGCKDIVRPHFPPEMKSFDRNPINFSLDLENREILKIILTAAEGKLSEKSDFFRGSTNLDILLSATNYWNEEIANLRNFGLREEMESAIEVFRLMIIVTDLDKKSLALEINHLLSEPVINLKLPESFGLEGQPKILWSRAQGHPADSKKLARAILHPVNMIKSLAASLLRQGVGGKNSGEELKQVIRVATSASLFYAAYAGGRIWKDDAKSILLNRFGLPPSRGTGAICYILGTLPLKKKDRSEVCRFLFESLGNPDPEIASGAALGIQALKPKWTRAKIAQMDEAFKNWRKKIFLCQSCNTEAPRGTCPKCYRGVKNPFGPIIQELTKSGHFSLEHLTPLAGDKFHDISRAAIESSVWLIQQYPGKFDEMIANWLNDAKLASIFETTLKLPSEKLALLSDRLLQLRRCQKPPAKPEA